MACGRSADGRHVPQRNAIWTQVQTVFETVTSVISSLFSAFQQRSTATGAHSAKICSTPDKYFSAGSLTFGITDATAIGNFATQIWNAIKILCFKYHQRHKIYDRHGGGRDQSKVTAVFSAVKTAIEKKPDKGSQRDGHVNF